MKCNLFHVFYIVIFIVSPLNLYSRESLSWDSVLKKIKHDYPSVKNITTNKLLEKYESLDKDVLVLDIRSLKEYEVSHLKGAILIESYNQFIEQFRKIKKDKLIVVYCSVGERSSKFEQVLQEHGYTNVYNLTGSIFAWTNEGKPIFKGANRAKEVHPYNKKWGRLLKLEE